MSASRLKWAAWTVGFGVAAVASGRSIPVHRVYSQPIVFYDEMGLRTDYDEQAPDLVAMQSLRDTKSRESLMGRETLMEMTMEPGHSVFSQRTDSFRGALPPAASSEPDGRRRQDDSSRNWLVQSLTLPSLGQVASNTALMAMSGSREESTWGWLADEVAQKAEQQSLAMLLEEGLQTELEAGSQGAANPFGTGLTGPRVGGPAAESAPRAAAPVRDEGGGRTAERTRDLTPAAGRESPMPERASAAVPTRGQDGAPRVADMSQTRQLLSDMSTSVRVDLPDLRTTRDSGSALPSGRDTSASASRMGRASSGYSPGPAWSGMGTRSTSGMEPVGPGRPSSQPATWQGGWSSSGTGDRSPLRFDSMQDAAPPPVAPAATRGMPATAPSPGRRLGW